MFTLINLFSLSNGKLIRKLQYSIVLFCYAVLTVSECAISQENKFPDCESVTEQWLVLQENLKAEFSNRSYDRALLVATEAYELAHNTCSATHANTLTSLFNLGVISIQLGDAHLGETHYLSALAGREDTFGLGHLDTYYSLLALTGLYQQQGRHIDAQPYLDKTLLSAEKLFGKNSSQYFAADRNIADNLAKIGYFLEAEQAYRRNSERVRNTYPADSVYAIVADNNLGTFLSDMGRYNEAVIIFEAQLEMLQRLYPDMLAQQSITAINLAQASAALGKFHLAETSYELAAGLIRTMRSDVTTNTLIYTPAEGFLYVQMQRYEDALNIFEVNLRSLMEEPLTSPEEMFNAHYNLGGLYLLLEDLEAAFAHIEEMGMQLRRMKDGANETNLALYYSLFADYVEATVEGSPATVLFSKLSLLPFSREEVSFESNDARTFSFRKKFQNQAAQLYDNLIVRRRYEEAALVLRLLKGQHTELVGDELGISLSIPLTPQEQSWLESFEAINKGGVGDTFDSIEPYTDKVSNWLAQIESATKAYDLSEQRNFETDLQDVMIRDLSAVGSKTGMLQFGVSGNRLHGFLATHNKGFKHFQSDVYTVDVSSLIFKARDQLGIFGTTRSTRVGGPADLSIEPASEEEIKATLKQLHNLLMPAEVEAMLEEAGVEHVILNLQGQLRYVPFAALYDGDQYLAEKYELSRFTFGDFDYEENDDLLSGGAGFGMSDAVEGFQALPGVKNELDTIFSNDGEGGVFSGKPLLNADFTLDALKTVLQSPPSVLHIASHFDMRPGQDAGNSALLLGDGSHLTLNEINASPALSFEGVNLLVLSACSTARSTEGSGIEVEGLGAIAQLRGAEAVMATLWNVADDSTAEFMNTFYSELAKPDVNKAQALRIAQLSLLKSEDYSHPYYWAPYILMGNWK